MVCTAQLSRIQYLHDLPVSFIYFFFSPHAAAGLPGITERGEKIRGCARTCVLQSAGESEGRISTEAQPGETRMKLADIDFIRRS